MEGVYRSKVSEILDNCGDRYDGAEICADILKVATNSREAYLGLCSLGAHGVSDVGRYSLEKKILSLPLLVIHRYLKVSGIFDPFLHPSPSVFPEIRNSSFSRFR